jgi:hypothetical protein
MVVAVCCRCGDKNRVLRKLLAKGGERRARGFGFPASFGLRKPDRASSSQPQHTNFPPTSTPLYSHSSTRFIRDYERQHDPPKGQQACTVSLSLVRHHIRGHHNKVLLLASISFHSPTTCSRFANLFPTHFCRHSTIAMSTIRPDQAVTDHTSTPQNTPLDKAPISSRAQQPGVSSIKEGMRDRFLTFVNTH